MNIEMYALGLVGIVIIVTQGLIFENFRGFITQKSKFLGDLFSCPMCFGFWVGLISGVFIPGMFPPIFGGIISLTSWTIYNVVDAISNISLYYMNLIANMNNSDMNNSDGEKDV